jgi:hypothetical protein
MLRDYLNSNNASHIAKEKEMMNGMKKLINDAIKVFN